jgi:hypothetical protein
MADGESFVTTEEPAPRYPLSCFEKTAVARRTRGHLDVGAAFCYDEFSWSFPNLRDQEE